jgi:membrane fusion protein (multidrug efflux system)
MDGITHTDAAQGGGARTTPPAPPAKRRLLPIVIILAVLAAAGFGGWRYYQSASQYETTDDAFIDGHISDVAAQISGRVISLAVDDNQKVAAGQVLLQIDPRDLQMRLAQARAQRANAAASVQQMQAQLALQQANIDQATANARVTQADLTSAQQDLARFRTIDQAAITRQQLDNASATASAAAARLEANRQAILAARAQLAASTAALAGAQAQLAAADADVANAELQLSYATVTAPVAGMVARRSVALGNYITAGEALMAIVPNDVWVTANFKETQTGHMHAGQPVEIGIDQYPGLTFHGHVDSFQTGTGVVFSALPAENATGNYVKVVQRVPVKILFDPRPPDGGTQVPPDLRLAPGLSVTPRVKIQ